MILDDTRRLAGAQTISATSRELDRLAESGLLGATLPVSLGGSGVGEAGRYGELVDMLCMVGANDLAAGRIFEGHINALALIEQHAGGSRRAAWSQDARDGRWFGVWNTESPIPVTAELHGDVITLRGAKIFCSGAGRVERAVITATCEDGSRRMLVVPMEHIAAERIDTDSWRPLGMQDSDSYAVDFDGVVLSADAAFGAPNAYLEEPWFTGGAIRFAAVQLGGAERLAREATEYIRDRGRIADPFQQQRAAESAIAVETGRLWLAQSAAHADRVSAEQRRRRCRGFHALCADDTQRDSKPARNAFYAMSSAPWGPTGFSSRFRLPVCTAILRCICVNQHPTRQCSRSARPSSQAETASRADPHEILERQRHRRSA